LHGLLNHEWQHRLFMMARRG